MLKTLGLAIVVLWFLFGGIGHFTNTEFFLRIMPPYVMYHLVVVYVSGVFELIGVAGLLVPRYRPTAGIGLIVLTVCVTPANIHMWLNPEQFSEIPSVLLSVRLVVQVLLIACIWFSTQPASRLGKGFRLRSLLSS